jgi:hypothetical protein
MHRPNSPDEQAKACSTWAWYHGPLEKRLFFGAGLAIFLFAMWPSVTLFNRTEPFILGLPPFVFFSLVVFVAVPILLLAALLRKI